MSVSLSQFLPGRLLKSLTSTAMAIYTLVGTSLFLPAAQSAVILQYHHVSKQTPASTSISPEAFKTHMDWLAEQNLEVVSLSTLLNAVKSNAAGVENMVAITFDDGYLNVFDNARPVLKEKQWPYAIFVNPGMIDRQFGDFMTWEQLRTLIKEGVEIGNHTGMHQYLIREYDALTKAERLKRIKQEIEQAELRITQETQQAHQWLAYPYGEFSIELQNLVRAMGYTGFGQHSGAIGPTNNFTRLPRFPASGIYSNLETLSVKLKSLPFAITALENADPKTMDNKPALKVTIDVVDFDQRNLRCYVSGQGMVHPEWVSDTSFIVQAEHPLPPERSRYNCTARSQTKSGRYYWFSQPWLMMAPEID